MLFAIKFGVVVMGAIVYLINVGCSDPISKALSKTGEFILFWGIYYTLIS